VAFFFWLLLADFFGSGWHYALAPSRLLVLALVGRIFWPRLAFSFVLFWPSVFIFFGLLC
jgi:hypothetical protein